MQPIPLFPGYSVSRDGSVVLGKRGRPLRLALRHGHTWVKATDSNGGQHSIAVDLLVALAWGTDPAYGPSASKRGERHPQHHLTWKDIRAIRASSNSVTSLASRYDISHQHISNIRQGKRWKDSDAR